MNQLPRQIQYVNETFNTAREIGVIHLKAQKDEHESRLIHVDGKPMVNFVANNYIGLEADERVKAAAMEAVDKYGIFTSITRTYLSFDHYIELEEKFEKIFGLPAAIANNTTLGHFTYLPLIIGKNDAIIIDQFVHNSVQMAVQYLKGAGIPNITIRHNQMGELEKQIKELSKTYKNIWYLTDSIFSMHGDSTPFKDLEVLLNSYENFHLYVDDAHGMSWIGQNGKGAALHNIAKHERLYVICSLNKGFGASNAVMVFPDKKVKEVVTNCGSSLIFCTPTLHAGVAAASRIADIHLTDEIYERQVHLSERIKLFKQKAKEYNLPLANHYHSPLFYVGLGSLEKVFMFSKHLQEKGFLICPASAPSVPIKQSGLRISLNYHITLQDTENLVYAIAEYMEDLEKKGLFNREEALKAFRSSDMKLETA